MVNNYGFIDVDYSIIPSWLIIDRLYPSREKHIINIILVLSKY